MCHITWILRVGIFQISILIFRFNSLILFYCSIMSIMAMWLLLDAQTFSDVILKTLPLVVSHCIQYVLYINCRNGDLDEINKHGSLHQYLLHLHQNGHQPINTFWWGQERLVSVCSTELIKDAAKLTNTPSKKLQ